MADRISRREMSLAAYSQALRAVLAPEDDDGLDEEQLEHFHTEVRGPFMSRAILAPDQTNPLHLLSMTSGSTPRSCLVRAISGLG
jgi:hypothetical protein